MKKKTLLTSLMSIAMLASITTGATYALFTAEDTANIAITSAKVKVEAKVLEDFAIKSLDTDLTNVNGSGTFSTGGTATVSNGDIKLDRMVPGDRVEFKVQINNLSNVDVAYKVYAVVDGELVEALEFTQLATKEYSSWKSLPYTGVEAVETINCVVELPESVGNEYQEKTANIKIVVEAVQGNAVSTFDGAEPTDPVAALAEVTDETTKEVSIDNPSILAAFRTVVNSGEKYEGYTVKLTDDLDFNNIPWTPIGSNADNSSINFSGTFDGNGHVVSNMYANRKDTASFNAGLFGYVTSSSTIKNLGVTGELTVSSYSGGLVGSNSGIIENCWADVDMNVASGEGAYRYVGGFVGNNFGTIKNSYSIGTVLCDRDYGSFVGSNEGTIEYCYTTVTDGCDRFVGYGYNPAKSKIFDSVDEMLTHNWSESLPSDSWNFEAGLPTLKPSLEEFNLRGISLNIVDKVYKGDKINLDVDILPAKFEEQYINDVEYEIEGEGYFIIGNYINTSNATESSVTVKATLKVDGKTYTSEKVVNLYTKVESLTIEHNLTELEAGKRYLLEATCTPSDALDPVSYYLLGNFIGATLVDNILTIDDEFTLDTISFYAMSESGVKSKTITLPVKRQLAIDSGTLSVYVGENNNFEYTFQEGVDLTDLVVKVYGKEIDYTVNGNTVTFNRSLLEDAKDSKVRVIFELNDGTIYGSDAYYFSHVRYNETNVTDAIKITSVEDFFNYFNSGATEETYDSTKTANYDKTYILMNDLDFGGQEITAIGYGDVPFSGIFYGNGHTISNFKIKKNERYFVDGKDVKNQPHAYGIGLFGALTGSIYDLTVKDATVDGKNFCGGIVGTLNGHIENCDGINLKVYASEYQSSVPSESIYVGKLVGRNFSGSTMALYYNNASLNTVG